MAENSVGKKELEHRSFVRELARPSPEPGGGAAAAYVSSVGLALAEKIARLEARRVGSKAESMGHAVRHMVLLRARFEKLIREDGVAYRNLVSAIRGEVNGEARRDAIRQAVECPRNMMRASVEALGHIHKIGVACKPHLVPDILVACELVAAGARGAFHIGVSNLSHLQSNQGGDELKAALREDLREALRGAAAIRRCLGEQLGKEGINEAGR